MDVKATESARGATGHTIPAAPVKAHFLFFDGGRAVQLLSTTVRLIDAADEFEDGIIGMDVMRGVSLKGGEARVSLAADDDDAELLDSPLGRAALSLEALMELEDCGCRDVLAPVLREGLGEWSGQPARAGAGRHRAAVPGARSR